MDVSIVLEQRFARRPDGSIWSQGAFAHSFWTRYLDVFDRVHVVARVRDLPELSDEWIRSDGEAVGFVPIPYYVGPRDFLAQFTRVRRELRASLESSGAVLLRVCSPLGSMLVPVLRKSRRPYGLEVVGDPHDTFSPGAVDHAIRPFFRWWFAHALRQHCRSASSVAYVTERSLQERYPPSADVFQTHYSSVELNEAAFALTPRCLKHSSRDRVTLITVASLSQLYKGVDVLVAALSLCSSHSGCNFRLVVLGDGRHRPILEDLARRLGVADRVEFLGQVPSGDAVRAQLDAADLFILPSRTEGLPRAMIEAMARGLPCLGTLVGGIPELLPAEDLVPKSDPGALANKIIEVIRDPCRMALMSARNLTRAEMYRDTLLSARRREHYIHLRQQTEEWLRTWRTH